MTDPSYNYGRQDPYAQGHRQQPGYPHQPGYSAPPGYPEQSGYPDQADYPEQPAEPQVNLGRLWAGGLGTAVVVALVIVVAIMLVRGILNIPVLSPEGAGTYGTVSTTSYAIAGAAAAIVATGLLNLLLALMPNPLQFFYWITGLVTALAVLLPFTLVAGLDAKIATAVINLIAGLCIITLLGSIGAAVGSGQRRQQY